MRPGYQHPAGPLLASGYVPAACTPAVATVYPDSPRCCVRYVTYWLLTAWRPPPCATHPQVNLGSALRAIGPATADLLPGFILDGDLPNFQVQNSNFPGEEGSQAGFAAQHPVCCQRDNAELVCMDFS